MNMMVVACGDTAILIDAGVMFPEPELLGVDLIIPDLRQLQQYKLSALVLTHGHEDHIGAVPHVLPYVRRPGLRNGADAGVGGNEVRGERRSRRAGRLTKGPPRERVQWIVHGRVPSGDPQHARLRRRGDRDTAWA